MADHDSVRLEVSPPHPNNETDDFEAHLVQEY